ncbi:hypothetical protein [Burkholderia pseudomallei]|uniref:hypothetical protein n=1 Tax=Burkholderia pseudomallei TaxID=28450 RepID=UPI001EF134E7|nr:hypothetical protein [Burkholderia pseudomallei]
MPSFFIDRPVFAWTVAPAIAAARARSRAGIVPQDGNAPARAGAQRRRARAAIRPASACGSEREFQAEPAIEGIRALQLAGSPAALLLGQLAALGQLRRARPRRPFCAAAGIGAVPGVVGCIELLPASNRASGARICALGACSITVVVGRASPRRRIENDGENFSSKRRGAQ